MNILRKEFIPLILFAIIIACHPIKEINNVEYEAEFNLESAKQYFELVENLKSGESISEKEWDQFINLKGNRLYISENGISKKSINSIKERIELVYNPANDSLLKSKLSDDLSLQIRKRYLDEERVYKAYLTEIENNKASYTKGVLNLTRKFLPKRMHALDTFPDLYIHALWDGSASTKGIFVDIILLYDFDQKQKGSFISHELHHFMRESIISEEELDQKDKALVLAIESTFNEGLADMVDKSSLVYEGSDWWLNEQYMVLLNYAGDAIKEFNLKIEDEANGINYSDEEYREVLMHSVGHIPGQYMAQQIKDKGRLHEIVENADNPFLFFILYNEIASSDPAMIGFSNQSIEHIQHLNKKYN